MPQKKLIIWSKGNVIRTARTVQKLFVSLNTTKTGKGSEAEVSIQKRDGIMRSDVPLMQAV